MRSRREQGVVGIGQHFSVQPGQHLSAADHLSVGGDIVGGSPLLSPTLSTPSLIYRPLPFTEDACDK